VVIQPLGRSASKTDRGDAHGLSELLWVNRERLLRGERVHGVRTVHVPSEEEQAARCLTWARERLMRRRTQTLNQIHKILRRRNLKWERPTEVCPITYKEATAPPSPRCLYATTPDACGNQPMNAMRAIFFTFPTLASLMPTTRAGGDALTHAPLVTKKNEPKLILTDDKLKLTFGEERIILPGGLQPSLLCTRAGTLIVQAQLPKKPAPSKRISYPYALGTRVSRDGGLRWSTIPLKPGDNGLNMEGGIVQLKDGRRP
jgi:hypothetical protein